MLRMKNGDYVPKGSGLETVSGSEPGRAYVSVYLCRRNNSLSDAVILLQSVSVH